ncbi:MAG: M15 family peptidase [Caulobacteraceae bacterium]|nr:M15 family peptidase [Caulobacteraceae bacterium]
MSELKSYNGWPASKDPAEIGIKSFKVPGTDLKIRCAEKVAPLLIGLAAEFHETIEPIDKGTLDDWGYCFRMVRGTTDKLSNHSSGTAIDLNATKHALTHRNTFSPENMIKCRALAAKYGCKWGGDWKRADEMHFEIALNPKQTKELIAKLGLAKDE